MTWLYILLGIILLFAWLLTRKLWIGARFEQKPMLFVKLLPFVFVIPPPKKADTEKEEKRQKKPDKKKKQADAKKEEEKPEQKKTVGEYLQIFTDALKEVVSKLKKYLYLEKYIVRASIGTDDAAKTAVLYGAACAAASSLWTVICGIKRRTSKAELIQTEIKPDFIAESTDFFADIVISIRLWQVLSLGMTALGVYKKIKNQTVRYEK